jgi:hypothetical protein
VFVVDVLGRVTGLVVAVVFGPEEHVGDLVRAGGYVVGAGAALTKIGVQLG